MNRAAFAHRLREAVQRHRHEGRFAVLYIDVNAFKPINDTYGHEAGDAVLLAVAQAIKNSILVPDASIGVLTVDRDDLDPTEILRRADVAMYCAKRGGTPCHEYSEAYGTTPPGRDEDHVVDPAVSLG